MREKVEMLEHHAHLAAVFVDVLLGFCDVGAIEENFSRCGDFEQVQAPEEGGLSASGRTDHDNDIALVDGVGDIVDGLEFPVVVMLAEV